MKNTLLKKGLVVGIIVIFIGVGIQPAISNEVSIPTIPDCGKDNIEYKINEKMYLSEKLLNNIVSSLDIKSNDDCGCSDGDDYPKVLCEILWLEFAFIWAYLYQFWEIGGMLLETIYKIGIALNCPWAYVP